MTPLKFNFNNLKKKFFAFSLGLFSLIFILVSVELLSYFFTKSTRINFTPVKNINEKSSATNVITKPNEQTWFSLEKNFQKADCSTSSILKESMGEKDGDKVYSDGTFNSTEDLMQLTPNFYNPHSRFSLGKKLIYDKSYKTDKFGRRESLQTEGSNKNFLIFLGGSFVFGEGVNDDETLPSQMAKNLPAISAYNYGVPGAGLAPTVSLVLNKKFKEEIKEKDGIVLYFYFDFDLLRLIPTFSQGSMDYMKEQLFLEENGEGVNIVKPSRWDISAKLATYRLLSKSNFVRSLNIDFPTPNENHLKLFVKGIEAIRNKLKKDIGYKKFYVVALPDSSQTYFPSIRSYLEEAKLAYLDFSDLRMGELIKERPYYECDGHPTPETNAFIAKEIAKFLK